MFGSAKMIGNNGAGIPSFVEAMRDFLQDLFEE